MTFHLLTYSWLESEYRYQRNATESEMETPRIMICERNKPECSVWFDVSGDGTKLIAEVSAALGGHWTDWKITNSEGFEGLRMEDEFGIDAIDFGYVCRLASIVVENGDIGATAIQAFGLAGAERIFSEGLYQGEWESPAAWLKSQLIADGSYESTPASIRQYIDLDRMAEDMQTAGEVDFVCETSQHGIEYCHVFLGI